MSQIVQIVRPLGRGEFIPAYSTLDLLLGATHEIGMPKSEVKLRTVRANYEKKWTEKYGEIIQILSDGGGYRDIAKIIGCSSAYAQRKVQFDPQLQSIAKSRRSEARVKFDENFTLIKQLLSERQSITKVAERIGLIQQTLNFYVRSNPDLSRLVPRKGGI